MRVRQRLKRLDIRSTAIFLLRLLIGVTLIGEALAGGLYILIIPGLIFLYQAWKNKACAGCSISHNT